MFCARVSFPMRNCISGYDGIHFYGAVKSVLRNSEWTRNMRVDATTKAVEGHPSKSCRCMMSIESISKCIARGESMVLANRGLLALPLVADTREENRETATLKMCLAEELRGLVII